VRPSQTVDGTATANDSRAGAPAKRWSAGFGPGNWWRWSGWLGDEERQQLGWRGQRGPSSTMAAGVRSRKKRMVRHSVGC
jgi:hypothetical protein